MNEEKPENAAEAAGAAAPLAVGESVSVLLRHQIAAPDGDTIAWVALTHGVVMAEPDAEPEAEPGQELSEKYRLYRLRFLCADGIVRNLLVGRRFIDHDNERDEENREPGTMWELRMLRATVRRLWEFIRRYKLHERAGAAERDSQRPFIYGDMVHFLVAPVPPADGEAGGGGFRHRLSGWVEEGDGHGRYTVSTQTGARYLCHASQLSLVWPPMDPRELYYAAPATPIDIPSGSFYPNPYSRGLNRGLKP